MLEQAVHLFKFVDLATGPSRPGQGESVGIKAALSCFEEGLRFVVRCYRDRSLHELACTPYPSALIPLLLVLPDRVPPIPPYLLWHT